MKPKGSYLEHVKIMRGRGPQRQLKNICDQLGIFVGNIVELGVYEGAGAKAFRKHFPSAHITMIDVWESLRKTGPMNRRNTPEMWQAMYERLVKWAEADGYLHVLRYRTVPAAPFFKSGEVDLVYIDADHNYEGCKADIEAWLPKVRKGGIIAGHDYKPGKGVVQAVDEAFGDQILLGPHKLWVHVVD